MIGVIRLFLVVSTRIVSHRGHGGNPNVNGAIDYSSCPNLVAMFFEQTDRLGERPFLWDKRDGLYAPLSGTETAARVAAFAGALIRQGVTPGDRVMLVSENRPEWLIADMAIMAAGGISVPVYTTNTVADHLYIMNHSGARAVITSPTPVLSGRVREAAGRADAPPLVIDLGSADLERESERPARADTLKRDDTACIIYTSGTGGAPKGVMQSHGNILHNCMGAHDILTELDAAGPDGEVFLSFLPLSHAFEHTVGQFFPISIGAQIYYAEGVERLAANMLEARPTIMIAVPRLYESLRERILRTLTREGGIKERLFRKALSLGGLRHEAPGSLSLGERAMDVALDLLVRRKVAGRFGGRLKALVSGGAPLHPDVALFFTALGVRILQGYGQTECAPVVSCNRPRRTRLHTVGPALREVEVGFASDGEILVRGPLVMQGYWRDPEATRAALDPDGWLRTGDIGAIDRSGFIRITDRKKDIIVNSGGDNLSPQKVEGMLSLEPEIAQVMVHGDKRPHLVALIVPDRTFVSEWAAENGEADDPSVLVTLPRFRKAIGDAVERFNHKVSPLERVRRFTLTAEPFSVDNGQMTPTQKIRRHRIRAVYGEVLEELYG
ncbi:MAG: long-chain fatty acid--CoA ligase [Alphaproteobacteria bacterium]|nr:long-chain fatty acid--CoA ligase [Alphaproteobacteria bacterium]